MPAAAVWTFSNWGGGIDLPFIVGSFVGMKAVSEAGEPLD